MNKDAGITPTGQRIPNGMLTDNYPRNMWWVAAHAEEVTEQPLARWLLETPVVLYRLTDGTPAALYDRCPHRWAPLSEGHVDGDKIVCPYHGMEFNSAGLCTKTPTQHMKPKTAKIPSFAVREAGAYVWIWMGDQEAHRLRSARCRLSDRSRVVLPPRLLRGRRQLGSHPRERARPHPHRVPAQEHVQAERLDHGTRQLLGWRGGRLRAGIRPRTAFTPVLRRDGPARGQAHKAQAGRPHAVACHLVLRLERPRSRTGNGPGGPISSCAAATS